MKKIFTMIAIAAFMAACCGNANKKAKAVEEQKAEVEAVVDTCKGECAEDKACCEGEAEVKAEVEETVTEGAAEI